MSNTLQLVKTLKDHDEDFEWYPTTTEIINVVKEDIKKNYQEKYLSILDCGSGDGRVLNALTKGKKYAIEKARYLLDVLDKDIFVVGTEFEAQTLIDKKVDIVFSNPPYSVFRKWSAKIIKESNSAEIYLVIPTRWKQCLDINEAIELRGAEVCVLNSFNFSNAERQARAKVDIVKITLRGKGWSRTDPFDVWFDEYFKIDIVREKQSEYAHNKVAQASLKENLKTALVAGSDLVTVLETLYQKELTNLITTYQGLSKVDPVILKELDVNVAGVREGLCHKIKNLKDRYWDELFNNLSAITDKLTASSRQSLLSTLTDHTHVDFTVSNAHAVVCWVVKNANYYFDKQLITTVENMTGKVNIQLYKSNKRTFSDENWRYTRVPDDLDRYQLDYRVVLQRMDGLVNDSWYHSRGEGNGLSETATNFINDLCTIASNLDYDTEGLQRAGDFKWESNQMKKLEFREPVTGKLINLFEVRAFLNGNLHIRFNPKFICRLNVEFGRLKGWLKSPKEAVQEMNIDAEAAFYSFNSNLQLTTKNTSTLNFKKTS